MQNYSEFFKTLHDEKKPTGYLGRGTHYSVLRAITWHDQFQKRLEKAGYHDFIVIWDEDHDTRVIELAEALYVNCLLSPAIILGERKGSFSLLVDEDTKMAFGGQKMDEYEKNVYDLSQQRYADPWPADVFSYNDPGSAIINDNRDDVVLYLSALRMLWQPGIKSINLDCLRE